MITFEPNRFTRDILDVMPYQLITVITQGREHKNHISIKEADFLKLG